MLIHPAIYVEMVELYAPPSVNYGMIYPPAILVFIFTLTDSVISPLILIFGAIYFAVGCESSRASQSRQYLHLRSLSVDMVYKYKLIYGTCFNILFEFGEAYETL